MRRSLPNVATAVVLGLPLLLGKAEATAFSSFDERVACHRAVESVYWSHRDWPASNRGPRPSFDQALPAAVLEDRVRESLQLSNALDELWRRPVTGRELAAEARRMASQSRDPERLRALWDALDQDPVRVAECLVRPRLVERRARALFTSDPPARDSTRDAGPSFDDWWADARVRFAAVDPRHEVASDWRLPPIDAVQSSASPGRLAEDGGGTWIPTTKLPEARREHVAVWTGSEMLLWSASLFSQGSRYDPATDHWRPMSIFDEPSALRRDATAVWTGTEMVVWGGWGFLSSTNVLADGGAYDPTLDAWRPLATADQPTPRTVHTAVWTGEEMLIWGGCTALLCGQPLADGAAYDPFADRWTPLPTDGAPPGRGDHVAVWTGDEMLVWGGCDSATCAAPIQTGGRYDRDLDRWSPMSNAGAPIGRSDTVAAYSPGTDELIVWGGDGGQTGGGSLDSGGRYDLATDNWSPTSTDAAPSRRRFHTGVWSTTTGEMIVWGGCGDSQCSLSSPTGGRYDPATDSWTPTTTLDAPLHRSLHTAVWTGEEMIVWGGCGSGECQNLRANGGRYDPVADSWQATADPNEPGPRIVHSAVWTGSEAIVYGGNERGIGNSYTGRRYDPATDTWTATPIGSPPGRREEHTAVWTGREMLVWGGTMPSLGATRTGAAYDPTLDAWTELPFDTAPSARLGHTAVWTGDEMIVWGGCSFSTSCSVLPNDAGAFDPTTRTWRILSSTDAPAPRLLHASIWTGDEMIIWGGRAENGTRLGDGGRYDPALDLWSPISAIDAPSPRELHGGLWTGASTRGAEMIVWGGRNDAGVLGDGGRYEPATDTWSPIPASAEAPAPRYGHSATWSGDQMIVWGGCVVDVCDAFNPEAHTATGGLYSPLRDTWSPTTLRSAPFGRTQQVTLWTGDAMFVWGGWRATIFTDSGGLYRPPADTVLFADGFEQGMTRWDGVLGQTAD